MAANRDSQDQPPAPLEDPQEAGRSSRRPRAEAKSQPSKMRRKEPSLSAVGFSYIPKITNFQSQSSEDLVSPGMASPKSNGLQETISKREEVQHQGIMSKN